MSKKRCKNALLKLFWRGEGDYGGGESLLGGSEAADRAGTGMARESWSSVFLNPITNNGVIAVAFIEKNMNFIEETFKYVWDYVPLCCCNLPRRVKYFRLLTSFFRILPKNLFGHDNLFYTRTAQKGIHRPFGHLDETALRVWQPCCERLRLRQAATVIYEKCNSVSCRECAAELVGFISRTGWV